MMEKDNTKPLKLEDEDHSHHPDGDISIENGVITGSQDHLADSKLHLLGEIFPCHLKTLFLLMWDSLGKAEMPCLLYDIYNRQVLFITFIYTRL